tara:strand:- start:3278 stop:3589 length:312 start_codon:yes stop_codon:yes gene_type:complete
MTTPSPVDPAETSFAQDLWHAARYYLGGRRGAVILAVFAVAGGLALNWSWLVAAGIAPILISVLPCAAMCALGLCCMNKTTGKSGTAQSADQNAPDDTPGSEN